MPLYTHKQAPLYFFSSLLHCYFWCLENSVSKQEQSFLYSHSLLFIHDMLKNSVNSFIFVTIMSCRFSLHSYIDLFHRLLLAFLVSHFRVTHFGENLTLSRSNISRYILKHFQTKTLSKITGAPWGETENLRYWTRSQRAKERMQETAKEYSEKL